MTHPLRWRLEPADGGDAHELAAGETHLVGRGVSATLRLADPSVSRRHAELRADDRGLALTDLGSANGTRLNDRAVDAARAGSGDTIAFGTVRFRLVPAEPTEEAVAADHLAVRRVETGPRVLAEAPGISTNPEALRLARLIELARRLSGEFERDRVLGSIVDMAFDLLPADRAALLLLDERSGALTPVGSRSRYGTTPVQVPRRIADRALEERAPISTAHAAQDPRFSAGSVVRQQVRAALCVPLLADRERALGVLYVDSLTADRAFSDDEARLLHAFGGLAAVSVAKLHYADRARREELARLNLERYFAPDVAARIAARSGPPGPGGERRTVTVLFSDLRGFTPLAEGMAPEPLAALLAEYFGEMVDVVFEHGGTLDKYMGDALLAVWGAPLEAADGPDQAVRAAREMQRELEVLNVRWRAAGRPVLSAGIGLHYGEVFAGTIGSPRRLEYTVIGDVVNVAARLCEAAAPGEILVTETLLSRLAERPGAEPRPEVQLRGRAGELEVFTLVESRRSKVESLREGHP